MAKRAGSRAPPPRLMERFEALRQHLVAGMDGALGTIQDLDLSVAQAMTIIRLKERGPMTVGDLQALIGRAQGTTSHMIEQLEERGLVARKPDERDRRRRAVSLTTEGRGAVEQIEAMRRAAVAEVLRRVPKSTLDRLDRAIGETLDALGSSKQKA